MSKKSKQSYNFGSFFKKLMDNITGPITVFVFPAFIISYFLSLATLNPNIELIIGKWVGVISAKYTLFFAYIFFALVLLFALYKLEDSINDIQKLKKRYLKVIAWLIIAFLALGFAGSSVWTIIIIDAQRENIKMSQNYSDEIENGIIEM